MFWGLIVEPGKKYTQIVENSFHISKATLDLSSISDEDVILMLEWEGQQEYILGHLNKGNKQEDLDLNFQQGDEISLFTQGQGCVHLSGYLLGDESDDEMGYDCSSDEEGEEAEAESAAEEEEDEGMEVEAPKKGTKRPVPEPKTQENQKKKKVDESSSTAAPGAELSKTQKKKLKQKQKQQQSADNKQTAEPKGQEGKKNGAAPDTTEMTKKTESKKMLPGGLAIEDLKVGTGKIAAASGQTVVVYYVGRLQKNNRKFDQSVKGPGFKFRLGAGDVIKGWDIGIVGMKIGGKRRITIPPHMAYGKGGSPPAIPPNSTLVFEVELKRIN